MKSKLSAAVPAVVSQLTLSQQAQASLIGNGTNTVDALFFLGASSPQSPFSEREDFVGPFGQTVAGPATIPVHFVEGALDLSTIDVGDTQIIIT